MTKTLQEIQEFNRRKIICAVNGTENYQEALKIELGAGCEVKIKNFITNNEFNEEIFVIDEYCFFFNETFFRKIGSYKHSEIIEIIGKPLTLDRVLLGLSFNDISQLKPELKFYNGFIITINGYAWDLTKPTSEMQLEETQKTFYELLGGEND
jgi:hypothetical protein